MQGHFHDIISKLARKILYIPLIMIAKQDKDCKNNHLNMVLISFPGVSFSICKLHQLTIF